MSTTLARTDLPYTKYYTDEETEALLSRYLETGDDDEQMELASHMPIEVYTAKAIRETAGLEYLKANFNLYIVIQELGEDWLDE